jgi:hypothetical protein
MADIYREGISKNVANVGHIAKCGIKKPHIRLNETLTERVKVL